MHFARRWPLTTFFLLAFTFTWALLPLTRTSLIFSFVALCGPAAAALITARLAGRDTLRDLLTRMSRWRVGISWYLVALLLPMPVSALRSGLEYVWGAGGPIQIQPVSVLGLTVFVLIAGEEIGWRGFALPRLLSRFGAWNASVVIGLLWALWHLPLFYMPGMPQHGTPFVSYIPYVIALSVVLTALAMNTDGSVIIAILFHGAVNTFGIVNVGASAAERGWANAVSYGIAAVTIAAIAWLRRPVTAQA